MVRMTLRARNTASHAALLAALWLPFVPPLAAQVPGGSWGVRLGAGTDISLGVAFGGQVNYRLPSGTGALEIGPAFYYSHSEETSDNGYNTYDETTDLVVFAVLANYLLGANDPGVYVLAGAGAGAIAVDWEERSEGDTSLGTPCCNGGSMQEESGTVGGVILNLGVGAAFTPNVDLRLELPVFTMIGLEEASAVVPVATVTLGLRF